MITHFRQQQPLCQIKSRKQIRIISLDLILYYFLWERTNIKRVLGLGQQATDLNGSLYSAQPLSEFLTVSSRIPPRPLPSSPLRTITSHLHPSTKTVIQTSFAYVGSFDTYVDASLHQFATPQANLHLTRDVFISYTVAKVLSKMLNLT